MSRYSPMLRMAAVAFAFAAMFIPGCKPQQRADATKEEAPPAKSHESASTSVSAKTDPETMAKLHRFTTEIKEHPLDDNVGRHAISVLSSELSETQLSTVEQFAATNEAEAVVWPLIHILVQRGRLQGAAGIMVDALEHRPGDRQYAIWKWWEANFEERSDYAELSRQIGDALFNEFAKGPDDRRKVVAEIFGKDASAAQLTVDQFRALVTKRPQ